MSHDHGQNYNNDQIQQYWQLADSTIKVTYLSHHFLLPLIIVRPLNDFERDICRNPARGVQQIHPVDAGQVLGWGSCYFWSLSALLLEEIVHGTAEFILD